MEKQELPTKIMLDMDGVLVDFVTGLCGRLNKENPYNSPEPFQMNRSIEKLIDVPDHKAVNDIMSDPNFWIELDPLPWFDQIVQFFMETFGKSNVGILSSPGYRISPETYYGKVEWIKKHLPKVRSRIAIFHEKSFLKNPDIVLVDDYDNKIDSWNPCPTCQIPQPWNRNWNHVEQFRACPKTWLEHWWAEYQTFYP